MVNRTLYSIFKEGSKTYFYSSLFFPMDVRGDVFVLYAFVRKADNFVDIMPQQKEDFYRFWDDYRTALKGNTSGDVVIDSFVQLLNKRRFNEEWVHAFLKSMEMDLKENRYETIEETINYMHGSAEVIGMMMARIMELPKESYEYARYLGRAMQYINFIRDIREDLDLGRQYLPQSDLTKHGLESLEHEHISKRETQFAAWIRGQIDRYESWQRIAEQGFPYIPKRYFIPIKTASDMYKWTAQKIRKEPMVVYEKKVKPSISYIVSRYAYSTFRYH
ncbi:MAG: phytoene/squalene synthase family protein [candidate division WOR-3 bacterium]|nr:MAG: phytoene/squalene synthase family protein [candidate division WOR-3 bacterium]